MRGTRHTEELIIAILKQAEGGLKTAEVARGLLGQPSSPLRPKRGGGSEPQPQSGHTVVDS